MGWKELEFKERWSAVTSGIQALATLGTFVVALVGIWQVSPIITYQVQQQESKLSDPLSALHADPLVLDAFAWWAEQLRGYRRIIELMRDPEAHGRKVSYEIKKSAGTAIAPGLRPDLLVVTAIGPKGREVASIPVNEHAMSPSQYVRFRVNKGAFDNLSTDDRREFAIAVERYLNRVMVPVVPTVNLRPDMSLEEVRSEVVMNQHHREEALRHIKGLQEVLTSARRAP